MASLYMEIRKANDRLYAALHQKTINRRDLKGVTEPADPAAINAEIEASFAARAALFRDVVVQFLTVYYNPSAVLDGEPVLAAMFRIIGGHEDGHFSRWKCSPIMDALVDFRIGFTQDGDLILMEPDSIARASAAHDFHSEVEPVWHVTWTPAGQRLIKKAAEA
jgi:hypothetical protein